MSVDLMEHEIRCLIDMEIQGFDADQYVARTLLSSMRMCENKRLNPGNHFWKNEKQISPICGSLATWGLGIDEISFASMHGTSTTKNDTNESSVLQEQMKHIGRQKGTYCHASVRSGTLDTPREQRELR
ncbi:Fatty acid synthase subunit alpha 1 [Colletotrichum chlorophyti]|uniref:Fatty acid synthase subunit alpha 1 n=1 Tax=Colletotrichum chlorophyti TaxID=708187 RepID=A0A1Q8RUE6_9PEZI|nr:Fatty acid synthase subunit alpha 1 [Colletotrichum chlorophyti]